jgi:hypothetical protein
MLGSKGGCLQACSPSSDKRETPHKDERNFNNVSCETWTFEAEDFCAMLIRMVFEVWS